MDCHTSLRELQGVAGTSALGNGAGGVSAPSRPLCGTGPAEHRSRRPPSSEVPPAPAGRSVHVPTPGSAPGSPSGSRRPGQVATLAARLAGAARGRRSRARPPDCARAPSPPCAAPPSAEPPASGRGLPNNGGRGLALTLTPPRDGQPPGPMRAGAAPRRRGRPMGARLGGGAGQWARGAGPAGGAGGARPRVAAFRPRTRAGRPSVRAPPP